MSPYRCAVVLIAVVLLVAPSWAARKLAKPKSESAAPAAEGVPPKDARWTLYCQAIGGAAHVEQANAAKDELVKMTGLKDWYVIHSEGQSVIYFGFYRSIRDPRDPKESDRAQRDLDRITAMADQAGTRLFRQPLFVEVTSPDPVAPAEWNLVNTDGYWTLQIAAYKDSVHRKEAAVEAVRAARAAGVPAFYYHGPTTSSVCVGVWSRNAVKEQAEDRAVASDPTQDLLVLDQPLAGAQNYQIRNQQGERVKAMAPRFEPADPSLLAAIEQYPTHAVNGEVRTREIDDPLNPQKKKIVEDPSFLVVIPKPAASLLRASQPTPHLLDPTGGAQAQGGDTAGSTSGAPSGSGGSGRGKLKSIAD
jgi:hypothetical protein